MKKWTKAERERASREGKARWAARKKRDVYQYQPDVAKALSGGSGGSSPYQLATGTETPLPKQALATDIVRLIAHDVPADVIVKVVERILRP